MFGQNQTTLFIYYLIPFEAIGGATVRVARCAVALSAVAAVMLIAYVGARSFCAATGLVAAALLALSPWYVMQSRWAHDGGFAPFIVALAWAALLWAGLPPAEEHGGFRRHARPLRAFLAGLAFGIGCYGYQPVRFILPLLLLAAVTLAWKDWVALANAPRGRHAIVGFATAWLAAFVPLAWKHLADPFMNKRAIGNWVWEPRDPLASKIAAAASRYASHFDISSLFPPLGTSGSFEPLSRGCIDWYILPLLVAGIGALAHKARRSPPHRVILAALLLYPAGDTLHAADPALHPLRSLPGLCALVLVAGAGAVEGWRWLRSRRRGVAVFALLIVAASAMTQHYRSYRSIFGSLDERPSARAVFHVDLVNACEWLRPRLDQTDAVFCTTIEMNMPYVVALVALGYDPKQWFRDDRRSFTIEPWEYQSRVGKLYFMYVGYNDVHDAAWDALEANTTQDRVVVIARPGEVALENPVHVVRDAAGNARLMIYETTL